MEEGRGKIEETVIKQEVLLSMLHALCALRPSTYRPPVFYFAMLLK
jgi:hypothetical protein